MIEQRQYPWSNSKAPTLTSVQEASVVSAFLSAVGFSIVAALLLTLLLWLVPSLSEQGEGLENEQAQVALSFLAAAGLMIILSVWRTITVHRKRKNSVLSWVTFLGLCLIMLLLLIFMLMLATLVSTEDLYLQTSASPAGFALFTLCAGGLSAIVTLKLMLRLRQQRNSTRHA